eukprot:SAG31_NODE_31431_length_368_cov_0.881041_1_plen_39_part_01
MGSFPRCSSSMHHAPTLAPEGATYSCEAGFVEESLTNVR